MKLFPHKTIEQKAEDITYITNSYWKYTLWAWRKFRNPWLFIGDYRVVIVGFAFDKHIEIFSNGRKVYPHF